MQPYQLNAAPVKNAPPLVPEAKPHRGRYITLVPLAQLLAEKNGDFAALYAASHGDSARERVWDYMPYGPFADVAEMHACYYALAVNGDPQFYAVYHHDNATATPTGIISYLRMTPLAYSIEIGHIWHSTACQRGRANTEAAYLLIAHAFKLGYRRLEWKCNALNTRSRQAALRLGLAFEGVFRQHSVFKGKNRDTAWFSLLDRDWSVAEQHFQQWLTAPPGSCSLTALNHPLIAHSLPAYNCFF